LVDDTIDDQNCASTVDEGMTNGPSTFAYLAFRYRRDAIEGVSKPTKMIAWRGPRTLLDVQDRDSKRRLSRIGLA
jgi:hypothetical protein